MEAVGQLTAGIAHDFNNLLTVVIGNIDRARRLSGTDGAALAALEHAMSGAEAAARLTDQLLSFARRQPLIPAIEDLNAIVTRIKTLFDTMIEDSIKVEMNLATDLLPIRIDGGQAENAILNLLVKARDAIRPAGEIVITTRNHVGADGEGVILEIGDTGEGMDEATRERIFEPFFTTKTLGSGTGLGLSQVYGFVAQSRGTVSIDSKVGNGTTVRLFLPRTTGGR